MKKTFAKTIGAVAVAALSTVSAVAATTGFNQTAAGSYDYNDPANWVGGTINGIWDSSLTLTGAQTNTFTATPTTPTGLTFNYAGNFAVTLQSTNTTPQNFILGGDISLNTGGGTAANVTIGNTNNPLSVDLGNANRTITVAGSRALTLVNAISSFSGSYGVTNAGAGTLTLNGANTYSGGTTLNAGTLVFGNGDALGTGTVTANGGTLKWNYVSGNTIFSNNLVVNGTTTIDVGAGNFTFNGNLSGSGAINRGTAATLSLYLGGDNSGYTGTFTSPNNGNAVVRFTSTTAGSAGASWVFNQPTAGRTTVEFNGAGTISFGSLTGTGPLQSGNATGTKTFSVGALGLNDTYSGIIANGSSTVALTKVGSGTMTLSGANTYTGDTTISAGTLAIGGAGKLGGGNYAGALIINGSLNYSSSAAQTLSGPISGNGNLTNNSSSTLTLSGACAFTGNLTANTGTVVLASSQSFSPNAVSVNDGATLSEAFSPSVQMTASSMTVGLTTGATNAFVVNSTSVARITAGTLTLNGANTINIIGGNLAAGSSYPLIAYTTLAGAGSYTLGTLPPGVAGNLSTTPGSPNIVYFNVTGVTNTVWTGAVNGTWDINTTANWTNAGTLGNTYLNGSPVQFDDTGLNTTTISNSVATTLSPISVLVTNSSKNYAFKANTIIGGLASLTKTGTANLTNSTPNTYTGPTVINQGQLVVGVASVANTSGALGNNSAVTLANDATAVLNLNNFATQIGSLSGGGLTGGNVALGSATLTVGADNSSSTYGGVVSGTGGLTKIGTGTLTLSGTNAFTGGWTVSAGTLNYNGSLTLGGQLTVNGSGANSIVNLGSGANLNFNNTSLLIGNNAAAAGAVFQTGTVTGVNQLQLGAITGGSYGYYSLSGSAALTIKELDCGGFNGAPAGVLDVTGGTLTDTTWFIVARGSGGPSLLNLTGGTVNFTGTAANQFVMNFNANATQSAVINVANANFNATNATSGILNMMRSGAAGEFAAVNLLSGGIMQVQGVNAGNTTGTSHFNFNGGTLKASTANAALLTANVSLVNVYSGGGTIDNNGVNITIPKVLSAPSGSGLNGAVTLNNGGSGYIGAPAVTFSGGGGTGATAYATVSGGAVTGVVITSPGIDYSSTPTIVFTGGGGSGAAAIAPTPTANTSGGMTFQGSGTTTLTGYNTYTGGTKVLGGTLVINTAVNGPGGGDLVVSNATLNLDASSGSTMNANNVSVGSTLNLTVYPYANAINGTGNLTVGNNTTNNLTYGTVSSAPSAAVIKATGTLAKGTNIVFNVSAIGLQPGWIVPLLEADSTAMTTNGFVLGTLPAGIKAVLTNSTANTVDLLVTSAGQLLTWHGSEDSVNPAINWDIATSTNWNSLPSMASAKYQQYLGNTIGDNVIFGDSALYTDGTNHVNVTTTVVPATVVFSSSGTPYELHGAGGIGGVTSVALTNNSAAVYLNTSNSYTGGTIVAGGTLVITNDNALGAVSSGLTLGGGALQANAPIANSRTVAVTANSIIGVVTNATVQLSGTLSGAGGLTKVDNGTLVLTGTNSVQGNLIVRQGTLTTLGTNALPAVARVGDTFGLNCILTIPGGVFNANNNGGQFASSLIAGSANGAYGDIVINGGTLNVAQQLGLGAGQGGYGALTLSSGVLNCGSYIVVGFNNDMAVYNQSGGTVTQSSNLMTIAAGGTGSIGVANFSGGTFNSSLSANSGIIVGERGVGTMNVSGSAILNLTNVGGLTVGPTGSQIGWDGTLNLNGGTVTANRIVKGVGTGTAKVNFNGGTIKAGASSATWLSGFDVATLYAGGLMVDDGGFVITIPQALMPATDAGVSSISLSDGGSGYIAPPIVTISGGSGSNATATATVSGGVVTAVVVTSPGTGYSLSDSLSVSFSGGGASVTQPTVSTVNLAPNTSGGLTKLGNGTLTLSGASTYTGNTVINAGKLIVTPAHLATNGVSVANGASYGVSLTGAPGTVTNTTITLASGSTALSFGLGTNGNPVAPLIVCGPLTNNGTLSVTLGGNVSKMSLGSFPLLKYSGTIQGGGSLNPVIAGPQGSSITLSNSTADSTLYAVVTSLGGGIVWTGNNANPALTNLWDLNSTTNWLTGGVPTTYQETTPPGDAVVFNDLGSGLVLLSNTASPASMTISNNSVNYSFQGSGHVSGSMGLTKLGTGSATLAYTGNDFTGPTVISNGVLNLVGGSAIGDSSAVTLADVATAGLTITNGETIGSLAGGGATGGNVNYTGTLNMGANDAATTFAGNITSADDELNKYGTGAMTLSGTVDVGQFNVDNSTVTVTGTLIANGSAGSRIRVGRNAGNATMNIPSGATVTAYNSVPVGSDTSTGTINVNGGTLIQTNALGFYLGSGNTGSTGYLNLSSGVISNYSTAYMYIGENGPSVGVYKQTGGVASLGNIYVGQSANSNQLNILGGTASAGTVSVGYAAVGQGQVIVSNATLSVAAMNIAQSTAATHADQGTVIVDNGTLNCEGDLTVGLGGASANGSFGTMIVTNGSTVNVASSTKRWLKVGQYDTVTSTLIVDGGTLNLNANTDIRFSANAGTGVNVVNLNSGAITFYSGNQTGAGSSGVLDFNRGANGGSVNSTFNLNGGTLTLGGIDSFYTSGSRVFNFNGGTMKPTTSSTAFFAAGEASAANVLPGGAIIDTAGFNITIGQALINNGVDEDGGLTKNGNGTLTLNGVNTYTNVTTVNAGLLGGTGTIAGRVAVNANAGLAPGSAGIGALTINGNITLNAGSTNVFEVNGSTLAKDSVIAGASVTYGGVLKIVPSGTFAANQQFQLFSGTGATNAGNFASIEGSPGSGLGFTFTNGVLSVVVTGPSGPANMTNSYNAGTHVLSLSWPAGQGWRLQMQTNSLSTGLSTNWTYITDGSISSTNITVDPTKPTVFYRLRYP